jgi:hypothetical protein
VRVGAAAARHRRQQHWNRVADAGGVVVSRPLREGDDLRRHERTRIEHLSDRLDVDRPRHRARVALDDDAGDDSRPERHDHPSADRRRFYTGRHGVRQEIETRDGDGYVDEQT